MPSDLNHPTGSAGILMVDKIGSHVRFFDPSSFQQIADVIVPARPHDLVFSPDHRRAYITIYGDGVYGNNPHPGHQVVVIDTVSHKLIDTIDLAPYRAPHGIQIDSEGNLLIACDLDRKIIVVDPATHKIVKTMDTIGTDHWIALLHDEKKIYTSNKNDQDFATVVSTSTNIPIARIPIRGGAQGLSASPDGKRVAILSFKDPSLLIVDSRNDSILSTIPLQGQSAGAFKPAYSPDGRWLIVLSEASNSMNIFRADDVGGVQTVLKTGKDPMSVAFSPDGNTALIANHGDGSVSVLNLRDLTITSSFHAGDGIETLEYF
jgi:DNA-binding beta-propeller fold protein YncE